MREAQRLRAISGTVTQPLSYKYTGITREKEAPLAWSRCKTSRRLTDLVIWHRKTGGQLMTWAGKPGTSLWTASLQLRTMEKGLGERLKWVCTGL